MTDDDPRTATHSTSASATRASRSSTSRSRRRTRRSRSRGPPQRSRSNRRSGICSSTSTRTDSRRACNLKFSAGLDISAAVERQCDVRRAARRRSTGRASSSPITCEPDHIDAADRRRTRTSISTSSDFDPFPSVSGTHTGDNGPTKLVDSTKNSTASRRCQPPWQLPQPHAPQQDDGRQLQDPTSPRPAALQCTLSGGSRPATTANKNKWKDGRRVPGRGQPARPARQSSSTTSTSWSLSSTPQSRADDKKIPLIDMSTKDLVAKIQGLKATLTTCAVSRSQRSSARSNDNGLTRSKSCPTTRRSTARRRRPRRPTNVTWTAQGARRHRVRSGRRRRVHVGRRRRRR